MYDPSAPADGAPPLVDSHAHIWSATMPFASSAWTRTSYSFPVEEYLATLDANGIGYGVIAAASLFGTYNDYTIRALRRFPRLRGTAIVSPDIGFYELERMHEDGIVGVRLQLFHVDPLPDFASDAYTRLFHRLRDLDMHVHVNVEAARLASVLAALEPSPLPGFICLSITMSKPRLPGSSCIIAIRATPATFCSGLQERL